MRNVLLALSFVRSPELQTEAPRMLAVCREGYEQGHLAWAAAAVSLTF